LDETQRAAVAAGQVVELERRSGKVGSVVVRARRDNGRVKLVVRKGVLPPSAARAVVVPVAEHPRAEATSPRVPPVVAPRGPTTPDGDVSWIAPLLEMAVARRASDLILSSGREPVLKIRGESVRVEGPVLEESALAEALSGEMGEERGRRLSETGSADFGFEYTAPGATRPTRFRVNVFRRHGGLSAVLRPVWGVVPTLAELNLPQSLRRVVEAPHGLVLFAGPTGSGKSTSLAALLSIVNETRACHLLTLEDPIEYLFPSGRAVVHQREVGVHMRSFADGLRAALRESPDIIFVGEMRDPETISLALAAAETGHLVLSTIHAGTAAGAIERVVSATPEVERSAVRAQLASVLRHVVVQQLLPGSGGTRIPAVSRLVANHAVAALIREGRTQLLATQMEIGADDGMVTQEAALAELVRSGRISRETALGATLQRETLEQLLGERTSSRGTPAGRP
jgi:twitching motility protein PilT